MDHRQSEIESASLVRREGMSSDARAQTEDLGDNSMKAGEYGIKNLQRILPNLPDWTREEADKYENLTDIYKQLLAQFNRYMNHVSRNVGSVYETFRSVEQSGDVFEPAPKARQQEAIAFLNKQLFETPHWLLDYSILNKISNPSGADPVGNIQTNNLSGLLSANRLNLMLQSASRFGDVKVYTVEDMIGDLHKGIWKELTTHQAGDVYRRNLQKTYVESLITIMNPSTGATMTLGGMNISFGPNTKSTDLPSIARAELTSLRSQILAAIPATGDRLNKYHLQDVAERIRQALNPKS